MSSSSERDPLIDRLRRLALQAVTDLDIVVSQIETLRADAAIVDSHERLWNAVALVVDDMERHTPPAAPWVGIAAVRSWIAILNRARQEPT